MLLRYADRYAATPRAADDALRVVTPYAAPVYIATRLIFRLRYAMPPCRAAAAAPLHVVCCCLCWRGV